MDRVLALFDLILDPLYGDQHRVVVGQKKGSERLREEGDYAQ